MSVGRLSNVIAFGAALALGASILLAGDDKQQPSNPAVKVIAESANSAADGIKLMTELTGGEWRIDGKWLDGRPIHARTQYELGVGKKFVTARTFVKADDGTEYQRYQNVFGVKDGRLTCWNFTFDGSSDVAPWDVAGRKISSSKKMQSAADSSSVNAKAVSILHQSIELVEPNKLHWLVSVETDGQNKPIMDGYWVREPSTAATK